MDLPLEREDFRSGFEELHSTEGENSALGISFDIEQGLSSQTPSKYIKSDTGRHKPAKGQLHRKRHEAGEVRGPWKEASRAPLLS